MPAIRIVDGHITGKYIRRDPIILSELDKLEARIKVIEARLGIVQPEETSEDG